MDRRTFLAITAASAVLPTSSPAQLEPVLRPEDFGARGDGFTNDSLAFSLLSARIAATGGGTVQLAAGRTYVVGRQRRRDNLPFSPEPLLEVERLTRPLTILGNGARLRAAAGLRFGAFDSQGKPTHPRMPNLDPVEVASPYLAMIVVRDARAPVTVRDIELDGNVGKLVLGGQWGDSGFQIPGSGIALFGNSAEERISNVFSHHHPLDGAIVDGTTNRKARSHFRRLRCENNGRQGLSIVGGSGYDFEDCSFMRTGHSGVSSPPGAGVDIEAEGARVRDITFKSCKFIDNVGAGVVADSGDSADIQFTDCLFVGTRSWAAWPNKPFMSFDHCTFGGTVAHPFASKNFAEAAKFRDCRFTDDPKMSPSGQLFVGGKAGNGIVNMDPSDNVVFEECHFDLTHAGVLPWSWRAIYENCIMRQLSRTPAMTKGKYLGRNIIDGPVQLYGSMVVGTVVLNGRAVARGAVGSDFAPW